MQLESPATDLHFPSSSALAFLRQMQHNPKTKSSIDEGPLTNLQQEKQQPATRSNPDWTLIILALVLLVLAGITWGKGGGELLWQGIRNGVETLWSVTLLLIAAFIIAGLTQVLVSRQVIERWLGVSAGWRGILLGCLAGAIMPGGPYVYYPIAGALLQTGASLGVLMAFITAKNLWTVSRLPYEFALLGPRLTLVRYALTLVFPPLLGMLAERFFGGYLERIREAMQ